MEILLHQRYSYAKISLLRNYSHLTPTVKKNTYKLGDFAVTHTNIPSTNMVAISGGRGRPSAHYFYTKDESGSEHAVFDEVMSLFYTEKDQQIKRNYNNPFAQIYITIHERTIKKKGDKIIITVSEYLKSRNYNAKYFRTCTEKVIFSFDFVKGNFAVIRQQGKNKNIKKLFRVNNFRYLLNILTDSPGLFNIKKYKKPDKISERYNQEFDNKAYLKIICEYFNLKLHELAPKDTGHVVFYKTVMNKFVELRKIKLPNFDCTQLLEAHYPKEPLLKKNDRKLIAAILDANKIKSKITIKLFHLTPTIPITSFVMLCKFFGKDYPKYISSINPKIFTYGIEKVNFYGDNDNMEEISNYDINDDEKSNIVKYINSYDSITFLHERFLRDLYDHFHMINKIKFYDPTIRMRARNADEFRLEHSQLSKIFSRIRKGWTIEYQFNDKMLDEIEKPVKSNCICEGYPEGTKQIILYPYVLKREEEYVEEGDFMHHCVASYADKDKSIIVSIRSKNDDNRVTCEFDIASGKMVQARHFCNGEVPEEFKDAVEEVSDKIAMHSRWGLLNWKEKKKVLAKINGIEVTPTTNDTSSWLGFR
jgi:hypothetical protein